ncbi:VOC family protein [Bosea caraganae]|uniref:VOC family protein n=1 Tax=Bosea caraganae TaxID=2763117 RepID=UPI0011C05629|nr:VOC family protein [Bosea caraganae]
MTALPDARIELMRPFIPARDFGLSQDFYRALGFEVAVVAPRIATVTASDGKTGFLLQDFYQKDLAENLMMQIIVPSIDVWWAHIQSQSLPEHFGVKEPKPPVVEPWGLRVAYVWDPSGILWHVAARN